MKGGNLLQNEMLKTFNIHDVKMFQNESDEDFALVELWWLADGNNSHHNPISADVLKKYAPSALGKFVVCKYNEFLRDATTHVTDETIVGYIPPNGEVEFKEKDGKLFAVSQAVLSKIYAKNVYEMFKSHNKRSVSVEFVAKEAEYEDAFGNRPITWFSVRGITILGINTQPSVKGAEMSVLQFSADKAQEYYDHSNTFTKLKDFSERMKEDMADKTYKVDKSKEAMSDSLWGDVNKIELRNKIMDASNKTSLVHDVYMDVEEGWEDAPSSRLKYPVMQFKGDTLVYNRDGLSSALGYAKAENDSEVVKKVEAIYEKLDLDREKDMAEKKFEIEGREAWGDVINKVQEHEGKGVYVDSVEKDHIIFTKDDVRYRVDADVEVGKDDKKVSATIKWDTKKKDADQKEFADEKDKEEVKVADKNAVPNDKKDVKDPKGTDSKAEDFSDDDDDDDDEKEDANKEVMAKKEKKMSYDANVDMAALNAMLEDETGDYKRIIEEAMEKKDMNIIMSDYLKTMKERDELKAFKEQCETAEVECAVDTILAEAKEDLPSDKFEELKKQGMECTKDTLDQFSNTVKAFAYDCSKSKGAKHDDGHINMKMFSSQYVGTKEKLDVNELLRQRLAD